MLEYEIINFLKFGLFLNILVYIIILVIVVGMIVKNPTAYIVRMTKFKNILDEYRSVVPLYLRAVGYLSLFIPFMFTYECFKLFGTALLYKKSFIEVMEEDMQDKILKHKK
jgi:hypothetical protein